MEIQSRPKLSIPKTAIEKVFDLSSLLLIIGNVIYLLTQWNSLPGKIPIHFNLMGEVDGWSSRGMIWFLPVMGLVLWLGLTILEKFPHAYNYMHLTEVNIEKQYKNARIMLNVLKIEIICFFVYFSWESVQAAHGLNEGIGVYALPALLIVIFGTMGFFIYRSFRIK